MKKRVQSLTHQDRVDSYCIAPQTNQHGTGSDTMKLTTLKSGLQTLKARRPGMATLSTTQEAARLRGRAAVERRKDFLQAHPYCAECEREGRVSPSSVPDHRKPLWAGGADDLEANGNALCAVHHGKKTTCEARMRAAGGWMATACFCRQHHE